MEDNAILDLYFARDEAAITETDRKYGNYGYSVANRIEYCNMVIMYSKCTQTKRGVSYFC